jgi:CBS domain-containing membrane protein
VSMDMPVSTIMRRDFASLELKDQLDLAEDVMSLGRIRHLPVLADGALVGIVSQRDLLASSLTKALDFEPSQRRAFLRAVDVEEVMSRNPITIGEDASALEAARLMIRHRIGCLPVIDGEGAPVGLITETDLLRVAYAPDEAG